MGAFSLGFLAGVGERGVEIQKEREKERQRRFDNATKILTEITLPAIEKDRALREERIKVIRGVATRTGQSIRKAKTALEARGFGEKNRADVIQELLREPQDIRDLSIDEQIEELRKASSVAQRQNPAEFFVQEKRSKLSETLFGGGFTQQDAAAVGRVGGLVPQRKPAREIISGVGGQQAPSVGRGTPPITPERPQVQVPTSEQPLFSRNIPIELDKKVRDVLVERAASIEDDQLRGNILSRLGVGVATRQELDIITAEITRAEKVKEVDLKDLTSELASIKDIVGDPQAAAVALATGDVAGFIRTIQSAPKEAQLLAGTTAFTRELRSAVVSTANLPFKTSTNAAGETEFIFTALSPSEQIKANALIDTANEFAIQAQATGKQLNANSFAAAARIAIEVNNSFLDGAIEDSKTSDEFAEFVVSEIDRAVTPAQANFIREKANEKTARNEKIELSAENRADIQDAVDAKRSGISKEEQVADRTTAFSERFAETISSLGQTPEAQAVFDSLPKDIQQKVLQILSEEEGSKKK